MSVVASPTRGAEIGFPQFQRNSSGRKKKDNIATCTQFKKGASLIAQHARVFVFLTYSTSLMLTRVCEDSRRL